MKAGGRRNDLFRAVDKHGRLIEFLLADRRKHSGSPSFLGKSKLSVDKEHRTCKYLDYIIEADHGALKQVIRPTRGFQT